MALISIQKLFKKYGSLSVLEDINLSVEKGMVYGIVGRNGAGKTTLFRCIAGLETYEGTIESELPTLQASLGLLMAEPYFLPKITGEEYIYLFAEARKVKLSSLEEKNIFNLPLKSYVESYSTGMKKKLALLAIILQDNDVFILDEPFNGLDLESSILLSEIIHRLKALGKTILISSHIFSTLRDVCDTIIVLNNGRFEDKTSKADFDLLEERLKKEILTHSIDKLFI